MQTKSNYSSLLLFPMIGQRKMKDWKMSNFSKENTVGKSEKTLRHSECQSAFISSFYAVYEAYFEVFTLGYRGLWT